MSVEEIIQACSIEYGDTIYICGRRVESVLIAAAFSIGVGITLYSAGERDDFAEFFVEGRVAKLALSYPRLMGYLRATLQSLFMGAGFWVFFAGLVFIMESVSVTQNPLYNMLARFFVAAPTAVWLGKVWLGVVLRFQEFTSAVVSETRRREKADVEWFGRGSE